MRKKQAMTSNTERRLSMYRTGKNYYPQVFVEEFKYAAKEKVCMSMKNTLMKKVNLNKC